MQQIFLRKLLNSLLCAKNRTINETLLVQSSRTLCICCCLYCVSQRTATVRILNSLVAACTVSVNIYILFLSNKTSLTVALLQVAPILVQNIALTFLYLFFSNVLGKKNESLCKYTVFITPLYVVLHYIIGLFDTTIYVV